MAATVLAATARLLVHEAIAPAFLARLVECALGAYPYPAYSSSNYFVLLSQIINDAAPALSTALPPRRRLVVRFALAIVSAKSPTSSSVSILSRRSTSGKAFQTISTASSDVGRGCEVDLGGLEQFFAGEADHMLKELDKIERAVQFWTTHAPCETRAARSLAEEGRAGLAGVSASGGRRW